MGGLAPFAWERVASVLRDYYGIEPTGDLHRKLRLCLFEAMRVKGEEKDEDGGRKSSN